MIPPNCSFSPPALYLFYSPMIKFPLHFWNHSRGSCYQAQGELTYKTKPQPGKSRHRHICLCHSSFRHPFLFFSDPAPLHPDTKATCNIIWFIWNIHNWQIPKDRKQISHFQGLGGERIGITTLWIWAFFWGEEQFWNHYL